MSSGGRSAALPGIVILLVSYSLVIVWGAGERSSVGEEFFCSPTKGIVEVEPEDVVSHIDEKNAPVVSLEGNGQHRTLRYRFRLNHTEGLDVRDVILLHSLPTVWFVDPFEKKRLVGKDSGVFESLILDSVDLESIEILSNPIRHAILLKNTSIEGGKEIDIGVSVHARYGKVSVDTSVRFVESPWRWMASDFETVKFDMFHIIFRSAEGHCTRLIPVQDTVKAHVPVGAERHALVVVPVTAASLFLGFLFGCSAFFS
jgi:hypothetical protein